MALFLDLIYVPSAEGSEVHHAGKRTREMQLCKIVVTRRLSDADVPKVWETRHGRWLVLQRTADSRAGNEPSSR